MEGQGAAPPLNLHQCRSEAATDYTKKQNVLRLHLSDGAEFLLEFSNPADMNKWLSVIQHYAGNTDVCSCDRDQIMKKVINISFILHRER
jgi:hypothetical protein